MKKILFSVLAACMMASASVAAPSLAEIKKGAATSYSATKASGARDIINEIIGAVGLKPRFEVRAADVPNAAAVIMNGTRYILYNEHFVNSLNTALKTDWAGISILAHEIGHHLNGHTLNRGGSNVADELEADEFSGFVLRKMGASLSEAQAAIKVLADEEDSRTHPGKKSRLVAISRGWQNAQGQIVANANAGTPNRTVADLATPALNQQRNAAAIQNTSSRNVASRLPASKILRQVKLQHAPNERMYITTNLNLVRETARGIEVIGKLQKINNRNFPYVLESEYFSPIFVSAEGVLLNEEGRQVGVMTT